MNREEAKNKVMTIYGSLSEDMKQAIDVLLDVPVDMMPLAVKAEAMKAYRELTGDYVSRKAVEEITWEEPAYSDKYNVLTWVRDKVRELTPINPDLSEFIDKLYKLAYERGKAEGQEWIPVREKMPEDGKEVLFCDLDEDVMIGYHVKDRAKTHFTQCGTYEDMKNVQAWMPLPTPYKQERNE